MRPSIYAKIGFWIFLIIGIAILLVIVSSRIPVAAQSLATATPEGSMVGTPSALYITVTYIEPINVRTGPSSYDYPVIGSIPVGGTAPAIGRSPAGEWIEIQFPSGPRGTGWVYAANVSISSDALLPIVEPPPTPTPVMTPTLDLTFVAQFQTMPTSTRLPTFTPPPTLVIPTFSNSNGASPNRSISTWVIVILGLAGVIGLVLSLFHRR